MKKITIRNIENLIGFSVNGPKKGENAIVLQRTRVLADDPHFYMYINQIEGHFLRPAGINGDALTHFFILFHNDRTADIYTDYHQVQIEMKPKRNITKGEKVYVSDINDVRRYKIEEIEFKEDDAVMCIMKVGWKYGLFFDFTRSTNEDEVWLQLGQLYNLLHVDRIIENIQVRIKEAEKPHIITEGKTDWKHIEAARRKLIPERIFGYPASDDTLGDSGLFEICKQLSKFGPPNKNKIIAIFDRDNDKMLKALSAYGDINKYQSWGNNVYSIVLPFPDYRKEHKKLCIELLYSDKDLARKDKDNRRLFFTNEIQKVIEPNNIVKVIAISPITSMEHTKKVYDGLSQNIEDVNGNKVAISKEIFAKNILEYTEEYKSVDFKGFKPLMDILKEVLELDIVKE